MFCRWLRVDWRSSSLEKSGSFIGPDFFNVKIGEIKNPPLLTKEDFDIFKDFILDILSDPY
jgi:hypothetical protein